MTSRAASKPTVAVCDLGTYSGLILIARRSGSRWAALVEERHTVDLLSDSARDGRLDRGAFERAAGLLDRFENIARQFGDIRGAVVCTSAVREAANQQDVLVFLRRMTGYPVRVLSARQEATLSADGAMIGLRSSVRPTAIVDVGGGSTEVVLRDGARSRFWLTDWGAARATARWKRVSGKSPGQRAGFYTRQAALVMRNLPSQACPSCRIIGVGGTIVTLVAIHAGLSEFDSRRLHGMTLRRDWIDRFAERLATMNQRAVALLVPFDPGRARVLTAGTFLWAGVLKQLGADRVVVSVRGLRWGVAARLVEEGRI